MKKHRIGIFYIFSFIDPHNFVFANKLAPTTQISSNQHKVSSETFQITETYDTPQAISRKLKEFDAQMKRDSRVKKKENSIHNESPLKFLGASVSKKIYKLLEESDYFYASEMLQDVLEKAPSSINYKWHNPYTEVSGSITAYPYYKQDLYICRPYTQKLTVRGETFRAKGRACRRADGTWKII